MRPASAHHEVGTQMAQRAPRSERNVINEARRGSKLAWSELFESYYPGLYRYFRARVGSSQQAEDLASDVFVEAFRSITRFRWRRRPFVAWLYGIARHQLLMHYRSQRLGLKLRLPAEPVRDEFVAIEIGDVLRQLPADYRAALVYRYVVGLSGEEAAAAMKRSHGAYRALLLRATRAFRREYGEGGER